MVMCVIKDDVVKCGYIKWEDGDFEWSLDSKKPSEHLTKTLENQMANRIAY